MFSKLTGIPTFWKYVGTGLAVLALVAAIVFGVRGCAQDEREENNQLINIGETIERDKGNQEVINRVEQGKDAVANPTSNELNVVCEKYDRNCKNN